MTRAKHDISDLLVEAGYDLSNPHFKGTPERWAKVLLEEYPHQKVLPEQILTPEFPDEYGGMVVEKDIEFSSLCAHHLLPFFGHIHIGYLPHKKVVGISKLARLAEAYAHQATIQEILTRQILDAIDEVLEPDGVIVSAVAVHCCVICRGIRKVDTKLITTAVRGLFHVNSAGCKDEFMRQVYG